MDFVRDQLATGRKLLVLTVVGTFSRVVRRRSTLQLSRRGRRADPGTDLPGRRLSKDDSGRPGQRIHLP